MENEDSLAIQVERASSQAFAFLPLPWRVIFLIGMGLLCWATNLHFLHLVGVDATYILDIHTLQSARLLPLSPPHARINFTSLYPAMYNLFAAYSAWSIGCWLFFRALCGGDVDMNDTYKIVPEFCAVGLFAALVCPFNVFQKRERDLFLHAVYRCLFSPMNRPIYFSDVVLADIFTSFAKVLGDLWVSAYMFTPWGSLRVIPVHQGWLHWIAPLLMSLPYLARLRQCLVEYYISPNRSNTQAFLNAIKYATALPVIFLSAAQGQVVSELVAEKGPQAARSPWHGEHHLFRLWLLAVAVNSGYSFWWDVTNDWGFTLLQPSRASSKLRSPLFRVFSQNDNEHVSFPSSPASPPHSPHPGFPPGLRPTLLFRDPVIYYIAISLNLILRFTWSLKLSSHLHTIADLEVGVFLMETLELIRRWVWVFFRVEWEAIRKSIHDTTTAYQVEFELARRREDDR